MNFFKSLFKRNESTGYKFPRIRIKESRPAFPGGTFIYPDSWYDAWEKDLLKIGWTKKELKQGWRWKEL
jgi:hypothetical protein